jgi:hypothetical protein
MQLIPENPGIPIGKSATLDPLQSAAVLRMTIAAIPVGCELVPGGFCGNWPGWGETNSKPRPSSKPSFQMADKTRRHETVH